MSSTTERVEGQTEAVEEGGQLRSSISRKGGYSYYYAHADDHKRKSGQSSYGGEPQKLESHTAQEQRKEKVSSGGWKSSTAAAC